MDILKLFRRHTDVSPVTPAAALKQQLASIGAVHISSEHFDAKAQERYGRTGDDNEATTHNKVSDVSSAAHTETPLHSTGQENERRQDLPEGSGGQPDSGELTSSHREQWSQIVSSINVNAAQPAAPAQAEEKHMGNFFKAFGSVFMRLFGHAATWVHYASSAVAFTVPIVQAVIAINFGPAAAAEAGVVIARIQSGLATLQTLTGGEHDAHTVNATLTNLQANLADLLTLDGIKNSDLRDKITANVNLAIGEFKAIQAMLPTDAPAAPAQTPAPKPAI